MIHKVEGFWHIFASAQLLVPGLVDSARQGEAMAILMLGDAWPTGMSKQNRRKFTGCRLDVAGFSTHQLADFAIHRGQQVMKDVCNFLSCLMNCKRILVRKRMDGCCLRVFWKETHWFQGFQLPICAVDWGPQRLPPRKALSWMAMWKRGKQTAKELYKPLQSWARIQFQKTKLNAWGLQYHNHDKELGRLGSLTVCGRQNHGRVLSRLGSWIYMDDMEISTGFSSLMPY